MADDNDKSPLTRRRMLGGMATIGAAGAVGAGTWAAFSDKESADVTATAGTLDLTVEGNDITNQDVDIGPVAPNEEEKIRTVTLKNTGNVAGNLGIAISKATDNENGYEEPEPEDNNGSGELDEHLDFIIDISNGSTHTVGVNDLDGVDYNSGPELGENEVQNVTFKYSVDDAGNEIQGDSLTLNVAFTLDQA